MGVWGAGNFQSDQALDYLGTEIKKPLIDQIGAVLCNPELAQPDERTSARIMAAAEILALLAELLNVGSLHTGWVTLCRDKYLEVWDGYIDKLNPGAGFKEERRSVIVATFERLAQAASKAP